MTRRAVAANHHFALAAQPGHYDDGVDDDDVDGDDGDDDSVPVNHPFHLVRQSDFIL